MKEWYKVRIHFPAEAGCPAEMYEVYEDEIRGTSPENALENALWNWPEAEKIELVLVPEVSA